MQKIAKKCLNALKLRWVTRMALISAISRTIWTEIQTTAIACETTETKHSEKSSISTEYIHKLRNIQ